MRVFIHLLLLTLAVSVAAAGCGGGEVMQSCAGDSECPTGQRCLDGMCSPTGDGSQGDGTVQWADGANLTEAGTCASGITCNNICCGKGQVCAYKTCITKQGACASDKDCINDSYCYNGMCIP